MIAYDGTLASIPAAIERLRAAGMLDLIKPAATSTALLSHGRTPAARVEPAYDGSGQPCCLVHRKPLSEGRYGLFCSAKVKPGTEQDAKGYGGLKFQ